MSLYGQYRPKSFADVAGQNAIVDTLREAVKQDKVSHAYLFAGIRGTGKTSIARILARELLTKNIADETLKAQINKAIDEGNLVDLTEIDAASNTGVDNIRDLIEKIQFTPVVAAAKVYIIDEVHMLSKGAFNALLKTLEEPPAYAYFILATTELHKIPATIQSRCQRFLFRQIREEDIIQRLQFIADSEHMSIDRAALRGVAHHSGGSMRDAISLLDQLRSLSKDITLEDVKERIGETGHEYVEQIMTAVANADRKAIVDIVRTMEESAIPLDHAARLLLDDVRTQLHAAATEGKDTSGFLHTVDTLMDAIRGLRSAPLPGLVLESALLTLAGDTPAPRMAVPSKPVTKTEPEPVTRSAPEPTRHSNPNPPPAPAHHPNPNPTPEPVVIAKPEPILKTKPAEILVAALSVQELKAKWTDILENVEPAYARMSFKNSAVHAIEGKTIILRFGSAFHRDKACATEGAHSLENALEKTFGMQLRIKGVLDSEVHSAPVAATDEAVNLAEAAADVF